VFQGLPAEVAGIGEHDIIIAIDGSEEADAGTIRKILTSKEPGDTCTVRVIQAGEPKEFKIKLQAFDQQKLGSATLIGKEPGEAWTSTFEPFKDMAIDMGNLEMLPQMKDRVFVAPDNIAEWRGFAELKGAEMDKLQPQIQKAIQDALKTYKGAIRAQPSDAADQGGEEVESKLDRLDKRMAQLEAMIEKLIEHKAKP
jgi:predicted metalloprotease with PDZ domain